MHETLFISDLHLDRERPQIIELFQRFLSQEAAGADALFILGDLFEYWIGDDACAPPLEPVIAALKNLADRGIPLYLIHGNRDFLIGKEFARRSGCRLLPDAQVIDLYGKPTLIMHGDSLCTDDVAYQRFRRIIRSRILQRLLISLSVAMRQNIAKRLRNKSRQEVQRKPTEIMDVNQQAVEQIMNQNDVTRLIHGHTHRPKIHNFGLNGRAARRMVLGDWYEQGSVLRCKAKHCKLDSVL
ncbi:MAG: UDP-2,3-diacylglucosamine diphosphatase [Gammaproteobacteria bacterium]|nr:UDP-2,3-diacylglucosamine diphosphatase [Gammaproteobacteria bacterium]